MSTDLSKASSVAAPRWPVLLGVWLVYFSFGLTAASMAPLVSNIRQDIAVNNAVIGLILGAWPITYIVCAIPCGLLLDRIGARRMLAMATLIMAASAVARSVADTPVTLFLSVALFGAGGPMISVGAPLVIARLYQGSARATAMGLYVTGPYLGGLVALAATNSLLMPLVGGNWRAVMLINAGLVLASGAIWLLVSVLRAADLKPGAGGKKYNLKAFSEILNVQRVRLILCISVGIFFINHGLNNWLPEVLRSYGYSAVAAGYWASVPAAFGVLGALIIPRFAVNSRQFIALGGLIAAVFLASVLLQSDRNGMVATALVLQGLARGSMMTVAIMILMDTPGVPAERLGLAGGMFFAAAEIGGVLGPVTFGTLAHLTDGFAASLSAITAVSLILILLLNVLRRQADQQPS